MNYRVFPAWLYEVNGEIDQEYSCYAGDRADVLYRDDKNVYFKFVESGSEANTMRMQKPVFDLMTVDGRTYERNWLDSLVDRG
jgi:hypothetical protein